MNNPNIIVLICLVQTLVTADCKSATCMHEYLLNTGTETNSATILIPTRLEVSSSTLLSKRRIDDLLDSYRHAATMAAEFSKVQHLNIIRDTLPRHIYLLSTPSEVAERTRRPEYDRLGHVVARIDLTVGIIYLGRSNVYDLYLELGKWFFYEPDYRWGKDINTDREHLAIITAFAKFCQVSMK